MSGEDRWTCVGWHDCWQFDIAALVLSPIKESTECNEILLPFFNDEDIIHVQYAKVGRYGVYPFDNLKNSGGECYDLVAV